MRQHTVHVSESRTESALRAQHAYLCFDVLRVLSTHAVDRSVPQCLEPVVRCIQDLGLEDASPPRLAGAIILFHREDLLQGPGPMMIQEPLNR